jgi:hypothetical protein
MTGLEEIDGIRSSDRAGDAEPDGGRLHGSFEILGHIGDVFVRRFAQPSEEVYALQYKAINQAGIFAKLNSHKSLSKQTYQQVLFYLSSIPVRAADPQNLSLNPELSHR